LYDDHSIASASRASTRPNQPSSREHGREGPQLSLPPHAETGPLVTSRRGFFWVGVERSAGPVGTVPHGPMFVYWEAPAQVTKAHPVVLIHGGGGQGLDWMGTPDGRPGWLDFLVDDGYAVYVVDRPGHGRASLHPTVLGEVGPPFAYEFAMAMFTDVAAGPMAHPAADQHTQWPGTGTIGDPNLDQFMASAGPMLADFGAAHALDQSRLAELLDRIGEPAIVFSHSAGGPAGFLLADARPDLVAALVAIEPMGPPFMSNPQIGVSLDWGVAAAPLTYDPPVSDPSELQTETSDPPEPGPPLVLQAEPARKLPNLARMPIAVVSSPASPFVTFGGHTAQFLRQAGCDAEHVRLTDRGVEGNGHLMMLERNNREALDAILGWVEERTG
jgi:pimeloyl-ACP methyl ester carboxylesterase